MADLYDELLHWSRGVITSAEADRSELKNAMVRADNARFTSVANGVAQVRKREGMSLCNSTPVDNVAGEGPAIVAGFPYKYVAGSAVTRYTVVLTGTGNAHFFTDDGSSTSLTPTASHTAVLTADITSGDAAEMNNRLFVLDNLAGQASFLDDAEVAWGVPPVTGLILASSASGADMTGDYDVVVTAWNDTTKAESDRSAPVSIAGLTADSIQITVDAVAAGLTNMYFRVYLRKQALGSGLWRVVTRVAGEAFVGGDVQGFDLSDAGATKTVTISISDAVLEDLVIAPPAVNSRGVPPSTAKYVAVFARRMFVADDTNVYWSELDLPDAFNPLSTEPFASPRGGNITALVPMANGTGLHVFTETGRHSIVGGADPKGWTIDIEDPELGAVNRGSVVGYRKAVAMWDSDHGPIILGSSGEVAYIGTDYIRDNVKQSTLNTGQFHKWLGAAHDGRMLFGVVNGGETLVKHFLVFNVEVGAWESTSWDPMDAASLFVSYDSDGEGHLYLGNYNGQLFRMLEGGTDGVRDGAVSGTFVAGAASISSITDEDVQSVTSLTSAAGTATATVVAHGYATGDTVFISGAVETDYNGEFVVTVTGVDTFTYTVGGAPASPATGTILAWDKEFDTTGAGLRQRRIHVLDADGLVVGEHANVESNTETLLTLASNLTGLIPGDTYTYTVGGPDFRFETYWGNLGKPFIDKRFDVLYSEFRVDEGVANIAIRIAFAWDVNRTVDVATFNETSSLWDEAEWDVAEWDGLTVINRRLPIIKRGYNYRIQLRNPFPNQGFTVLKLAVLARELSDRYAGNALR